MNLSQAWRALGIAQTGDVVAIRRAYAAKLKALDLDRDAQDYAALRSAREIALRWASQQGPLADEPAPAGNDAPPSVGRVWPYAAPVLSGAIADPALTVTASDNTARPYVVLGPDGALSGEVRDVPLPVGDPFAVPSLKELPTDMSLIQLDRGRDIAFYNLLFPGGEESDEALAGPDLARAKGHFHALLRRAQDGALALSEATDAWLGDTLARAWPRSAPFVAEAAAAFGWERQAGLLEERGAVAFLNARLKGMRFHQKVLEPDHVLHQAWVELCRPGRANGFHRLRKGRTEVEQLLIGVRNNFPELEHFWNGERVASWETTGAKDAGTEGPGLWVWILIGVGALQLLGALGRVASSDANPPRIDALAVTAPGDREVLDAAAAAAFGPVTSIADVGTLNPELAATIRANRPLDPVNTEQQRAFETKVQNLVRERVHQAALRSGGGDLASVMKLRLAYLIAARQLGGDACMNIYRLREIPQGASLNSKTIIDEQTWALHFLRAGALTPVLRREAAEASIPGPMVDQVVKETGLPLAAVQKAFRAEGSDDKRCAVSIALLRAALKSTEKVREPLLRIL